MIAAGCDSRKARRSGRYAHLVRSAIVLARPPRGGDALDGKVIGTSTNRVPSTAMHWVLQTESCLPTCPATSTAGNVQIDWVVAYARA